MIIVRIIFVISTILWPTAELLPAAARPPQVRMQSVPVRPFSQRRIARVDEGELKDNAENKGFGYKTANLMELQKLEVKRDVNDPRYSIQVPEFAGISSQQVKDLLRKKEVMAHPRSGWLDGC